MTFEDLQKNLLEARGRKAVLMMLADLLESEFLPTNADVSAKKVILMDDKLPVPRSIIDTVVNDLLQEAEELEAQTKTILSSTLQPQKNEAPTKGTA